ncbi:MAG: hypothetical protein V1772_00755 [Chloroflexota bacterium]
MPRAISITWSKGVSEEEAAVLVKAVDSTLNALYVRYPEARMARPVPIRAFGNWIIPALAPDRPYWGTQWYVDTSYTSDLRQVIAPTYLELVRQEPWQQADPHFDLALLDQDLTDFPPWWPGCAPAITPWALRCQGWRRSAPSTMCAAWPTSATARPRCAGW